MNTYIFKKLEYLTSHAGIRLLCGDIISEFFFMGERCA